MTGHKLMILYHPSRNSIDRYCHLGYCLVWLLALVLVFIFPSPVAAQVSPELRKLVSEFLAKNPKFKDEFMPFEQDCLDGKIADKACEKNVREQLEDFERDVALEMREAQVNAERAQVNAERAQVNAERAQVKITSEMVARLKVVTIAMQFLNTIRLRIPERSGVKDLAGPQHPSIVADVAYLVKLDALLENRTPVPPSTLNTLKELVVINSTIALALYNSLPPKAQEEFIRSKRIAEGAVKFAND